MSTQATQCRERAFKEFAEAVQDAFGERIHEIILYGSTARGEATKQSDVDVLVVFNDNERPKKLYELSFDIGLEYGVVITPHVQTRDHFESRQDHPFLKNVLNEGRSYV